MNPVLSRHQSEDGSEETYQFWCPGCKCLHCARTKGKQGPIWEWNGSMDKPTFSPSILYHGVEGHRPRCHIFVRDGRIEFCSDSAHELAGKTVDMTAIRDI